MRTKLSGMDVIPAIDLLDGNCVRLEQGKYDKVSQFNSDPVSQALTWQRKGAKRLHLVDLDGAKTGQPINDASIKAISKNIDIPIQIGGGVRSIERAQQLLDYGIDKVILGTIAVEKPIEVAQIVEKNPGKIIIGLDANNGKVATRGWTSESSIKAVDMAAKYSKLQISSIISTDISTDGTLSGPNIESLRSIANSSKKPVIASGGIGSIADLLSLSILSEYGVTGVIVGRALYERKFELEDAIEALSNIDIQDSNQNNDYIS